MKTTHTDYKHPGHLRVETGETYSAWYRSLTDAGWLDEGNGVFGLEGPFEGALEPDDG